MNRTSAAGFAVAFISAMLLEWTFYFMPLYFQGSKRVSAFQSGVDLLPLAIILLPFAIIAGIVMTVTGAYKPLHWVSFTFLAAGTGVFSLLGPSSSTAEWASLEVITAIGVGVTMSSVLPAIQSSLPEIDVATSTGTYSFLRSFGLVWGVVIPSTIFNQQINVRLDQIDSQSLRNALANGGAYGFASSTLVSTYPFGLQSQVRSLYADALRPVWYAAAAFAGVGFFLVFLEKTIALRTENHGKFGLEDEKGKSDAADLEVNMPNPMPPVEREIASN